MRPLHVAIAALACVTACGSKKRTHRPPADAEMRAPIDAQRVRTDDDRDSLFRAVPTEKAIHETIKRLAVAAHPAGTPENEAVAHEIMSTLGRLGLKTGVAPEDVLMPSFAGPLLVLDPKPRPIRNLLAIVDGDIDDAIIVGTTFDAADTSVASHAGTAALLEIARGLAALQRAGWHPHRTIILAWWDGGTIGDLGISTWVDDQRAMLRASAIAYLDIGPLGGLDAPVESDALLAGSLIEGQQRSRQVMFTRSTTAPVALAARIGVPTARWRTQPGPDQPDAAIEAAAAHTAREVGLSAIGLATAPTTPLDYAAVASEVETQIETMGPAPDALPASPELEAAIAAVKDVAPQVSTPVPPACDRALVAARDAFLVEDGLVDRPWYRNLRLGPVAGDESISLYPEVFAARAARDVAAEKAAIARLTAALKRVAAVLAPCAR